VATSTNGGQLKCADPDVGDTGNGHTSDDDDQKDLKIDSRNRQRRREVPDDRKRAQDPQAAGGQAAVGGDGLLVCIQVSHSVGMHREGQATAGSLSCPPTFPL
jgi:hypothetical protein